MAKKKSKKASKKVSKEELKKQSLGKYTVYVIVGIVILVLGGIFLVYPFLSTSGGEQMAVAGKAIGTAPQTSQSAERTSVQPENTPAACADRVDNDWDSLRDCADPECAGFNVAKGYLCEYTLGNEIKNNCFDLTEPLQTCYSKNGQIKGACNILCTTVETAGREGDYDTLCDDKFDNDGDGLVDCFDEGCVGSVYCK